MRTGLPLWRPIVVMWTVLSRVRAARISASTSWSNAPGAASFRSLGRGMRVPPPPDDPRAMRRFALAALAAALLPVGAWAAHNPHAEKVRLTKAGKTLAKRAVLRGSDLGPDWTSVRLPPEDSSLTCPHFDPDLSRFTINGKATSSFVLPVGPQINSNAVVYASHAQAIGDFVASAKPQLAPCLRSLLEDELRRSGIGSQTRVLSSRMVRAPRIGERAAAYRLVMKVHGGAISVTVVTDLLVVQRGRTIVLLSFTGINAPIPSRGFYARLVAARMR